MANGKVNYYVKDTSFALTADENLVMQTVLPCTCCPGLSCTNGTLDKRNCWCSCPLGYHGSDCDTVSRDLFLGNYLADDPCEANAYNVTISAGANLEAIIISNLGNIQLGGQPLQVRANMTQGHMFNIPQQSFNAGNITIMGSGSLHGTTLTLYTYWKKTVNNITQNQSCKIIMNK